MPPRVVARARDAGESAEAGHRERFPLAVDEREAVTLNSRLSRWTFLGPARAIRHLPRLGGSVYFIEGGSAVGCKALGFATMFHPYYYFSSGVSFFQIPDSLRDIAQ
jgi:hypothetical protein